ncbi:MAG: glycoside hydrolase family 127 protein [Anaerolineae bacterium]
MTAFDPRSLPAGFDVLTPLPLGAIRPRGWLARQLRIQADGLTGHLDEIWPDVGPNSAWLGGDGEAWERGPYYCDGLIPLAFLLQDDRLIAKAQRWATAMIESSQPSGWFGPPQNQDTWPLMVALKVLAQYHEATGDDRAPEVMRRYLRYLADRPQDLPHVTWRGVRYADNVWAIQWLYRHTGEAWLLELADRQFQAGFDWTEWFYRFPWRSKIAPFTFRHEHHVVNVAMAVKNPAVAYRQYRDERYRQAVRVALAHLDRFHGQVNGIFTGDEHLAGLDPTQGTELCAVVELMFSLEQGIAILGDPLLADRLERVAFNALPAACTPDMWAHQYDQQVNQVLCTIAPRHWTNNGPDSNIFGLEPNFGCCTANMHQGWPKLTAHLWMATPDGGLASVVYAPCQMEALAADGETVTLEVETDYPFAGTVAIRVGLRQPTAFPLHLRIPAWAQGATVQVNQEPATEATPGAFHVISRRWADGDRVTLELPMAVRVEPRFRRAIALARGPLAFSLKIAERWQLVGGTPPHGDWEIYPESAWNYGLLLDPAAPEAHLQVTTSPVGEIPFHPEQAPVRLELEAARIDGWGLVQNSAGPVPIGPLAARSRPTTVTLIPYGSTQLRITEFPWLRRG